MKLIYKTMTPEEREAEEIEAAEGVTITVDVDGKLVFNPQPIIVSAVPMEGVK